MPDQRQEWRKPGAGSARGAQSEAPTLIAELHAVFTDLFDPKPPVDRVAFAVPAPIDEDHALRGRVGIDQRLDPEARRILRRRRPGGGAGRRRRWRRCRLDRRCRDARTGRERDARLRLRESAPRRLAARVSATMAWQPPWAMASRRSRRSSASARASRGGEGSPGSAPARRWAPGELESKPGSATRRSTTLRRTAFSASAARRRPETWLHGDRALGAGERSRCTAGACRSRC